MLAQDTSSLALFFILGPRSLAKSIICKYFAHFINSFNSDTVHHAFGPLLGEGGGGYIGDFFTGPMTVGFSREYKKTLIEANTAYSSVTFNPVNTFITIGRLCDCYMLHALDHDLLPTSLLINPIITLEFTKPLQVASQKPVRHISPFYNV